MYFRVGEGMIVYDIFGSGHYLDSKTLEVTSDISCKVIQRAPLFFCGEYVCNGYVILFERNKIELFNDTVHTVLSIDNGCVYNNGLKINNKLKLPNLSKDTIFLVPELSDKYSIKLQVKDLGCVYNNGLKINNKLKLPNLSKDTIFLVPELSDKYSIKLQVKDLQTNRKKLIKLSDLDWVSSTTMYKQYRRRILLRRSMIGG